LIFLRKTKSPLSVWRQRAELAMSAELSQVHPRRRAVRVMMMAVMEMRGHFPPRILSKWEAVNRDALILAAIFSMIHIDILDGS